MFFFSLQMPNVYFILHYHLIFCTEIHFFECLYFSEYDIRSLYMFFDWERGHWLSTYTTGGEMGDHPKWVQLRTGGREAVSCFVCTCALALVYWKKFSWEEIFVVEALPQNISILREFNFADAAISKISWELIFVDTDIARRKRISYLKRFVGMIMRQTYWS